MASSFTRRINLYVNLDGEKIENNVRSINSNLRKLIAEQAKLTIGSDDYIKSQIKIKQLRGILDEHRRGIQNIESPTKKLIDTAKGLLPAFGFAALAGMAKMAFGKMMESTQAFGDKWRAIAGGAKEATDYFWKSLSSGNWDNFFSNLREAAKLGAEYVRVLDDIGDRQLGLKIDEANSRAEELRLELMIKNQRLSNKERIKSGEDRIKIEEDLSTKRVDIAQKAFSNEVENNLKTRKIGKEMILRLQTDWDSADRQQAEKYAAAKNQIKGLQEQSDRFKQAQSRGGVSGENPFETQIKNIREMLTATPAEIQKYGEAVLLFNDVNDQERQKIVSTYEGLISSQNSAVENTKKVRTMVNSLLAEGDAGTGDNAAEAAKRKKSADEKKALEELINAMKENPETDKPIDGAWAEDWAKKDIEDFASKKRDEEEWTKFLNDQVNERLSLLAKEYNVEKEIAEAKDKLKEQAITSAVESGMAAVENAQTIEEAGKAILNVIRQQIKAYIAEAVITAALKALKGVPFPLNIAAAAIAGGAAGLFFNKIIPEFAAGGYANEPTYIAGEAGPEWIAPNWMLKNPNTADIIYGLESMRRNPVTISKGAIEASKSILSNSANSRNYTAATDPIKLNADQSGVSGFSFNKLDESINLNTKAVVLLMQKGVQFPLLTFKKKYDTLTDLLNQTGMKGL